MVKVNQPVVRPPQVSGTVAPGSPDAPGTGTPASPDAPGEAGTEALTDEAADEVLEGGGGDAALAGAATKSTEQLTGATGETVKGMQDGMRDQTAHGREQASDAVAAARQQPRKSSLDSTKEADQQQRMGGKGMA